MRRAKKFVSPGLTRLVPLTRSIMTMENKRPAPSANGSGAGQATKKVATTATRQLSLTSMFAPVKKEKKPEAEESPKDARQLFKDLDNEIQTLLELEMATMHYEWVKALKTEFTKPYFLKVRSLWSRNNCNVRLKEKCTPIA